MKLLAKHGRGEKRVILEADSRGRWYITTNAETRARITPQRITGWREQHDARATAAWLIELEEEFGTQTLARGFARRCKAKGVPRPGKRHRRSEYEQPT